MAEVSDPGGGIGQRRGLRLRERDQVRYRTRRHRGMHGQHPWKAHHRRHRHEVAQWSVRELLVERRVDHQRRVGAGRNRVAVGIGLHQRLQADGAVGAGAVLDEYLLPEPLGEMLGGKARDEVGAASRRERHDHLDRPLRPGMDRRLRPSRPRQHACERERHGELGEMNAHVRPPDVAPVAPARRVKAIIARRRRWRLPCPWCSIARRDRG